MADLLRGYLLEDFSCNYNVTPEIKTVKKIIFSFQLINTMSCPVIYILLISFLSVSHPLSQKSTKNKDILLKRQLFLQTTFTLLAIFWDYCFILWI